MHFRWLFSYAFAIIPLVFFKGNWLMLRSRGIHAWLTALVAIGLALLTGLAASSVLLGDGALGDVVQPAADRPAAEPATADVAPLLRLRRALAGDPRGTGHERPSTSPDAPKRSAVP
jgi:hypothetical protein